MQGSVVTTAISVQQLTLTGEYARKFPVIDISDLPLKADNIRMSTEYLWCCHVRIIIDLALYSHLDSTFPA